MFSDIDVVYSKQPPLFTKSSSWTRFWDWFNVCFVLNWVFFSWFSFWGCFKLILNSVIYSMMNWTLLNSPIWPGSVVLVYCLCRWVFPQEPCFPLFPVWVVLNAFGTFPGTPQRHVVLESVSYRWWAIGVVRKLTLISVVLFIKWEHQFLIEFYVHIAIFSDAANFHFNWSPILRLLAPWSELHPELEVAKHSLYLSVICLLCLLGLPFSTDSLRDNSGPFDFMDNSFVSDHSTNPFIKFSLV